MNKTVAKKNLVYIIFAWCLLKFVEYYFFHFLVRALFWFVLSAILLTVILSQVVKALEERKALTRLRIAKVFTFLTLFYLTLCPWFVDRLIEKIDWKMFYKKRIEIVQQVKSKSLTSNDKLSGGICELPFEFPVISNGGNDVLIYRSKNSDAVTVSFWVYRNYFNAPSTSFVYTNDIAEMKEIENGISLDPKNNWKIIDNWYRTFGE